MRTIIEKVLSIVYPPRLPQFSPGEFAAAMRPRLAENESIGGVREGMPRKPTASDLAWNEELARRNQVEEAEESLRAYDRKRKVRR